MKLYRKNDIIDTSITQIQGDPMYTNNISVPHSYFKKAKKEYRNWMMALFREVIQNSVDAGATKIDFTLDEEDGGYKLTCIDNGSGMDEHILIDVLLCLGGSHKDNDDAIGGFGYAKTLLFFAHDHYQIRTKDNIIEGVGGNYNFSKSDAYINGTEITLSIARQDENEVTYSFEFYEAIKEIMAYSHLKGVTVTFDHEVVKDNVYKFDFQYPTTIGNVIFKDMRDAYASKLWVRINGLAMFQHYVWSENKSCFLGILELSEAPTKVLTTNRDSLKGQAEAEFNKIFASLQDERSSLKTNKIMNWTLNQFDFSIQSDDVETVSEKQKENQSVALSERPKTGYQVSQEENNEPDPFAVPPETADFSPFQKLIEASEKEKHSIEKLFKDIDEEKLPINFKIQKDDSCSIKNHQIKKELSKKNNIKLAHRWNKIIYSVIASIQGFTFYDTSGCKAEYVGQNGIFYHNSRPVYVGFIFGDNSRAVNASNKDAITIMINPVSVKFNTKISKLYDIAFHEVTHIFIDNHNENFCVMEMEIKWGFRDFWNVTEIKKFGEISF